MLLQSHNGKIRVFPATPESWSGKFAHLRATGAFLVSSEKNEDVRYITILSEAGQTCRIRNPWPNDENIIVHDLTNDTLFSVEGQQDIEFKTTKNNLYRIVPSKFVDKKPDSVISGKRRDCPRTYHGPQYLTYDPKQKQRCVSLGFGLL